MESVNALELRQSLGKVAARLHKTGAPILLKRGHQPVAVLITLDDFRERFAEQDAAARRLQILGEMDALARPSSDGVGGVTGLRALRDPI